MPSVTCRTCGQTQELSHLAVYSPIHLFPGLIYVYCPQCKRFRLHRRVDSKELSPKEAIARNGNGPIKKP